MNLDKMYRLCQFVVQYARKVQDMITAMNVRLVGQYFLVAVAIMAATSGASPQATAVVSLSNAPTANDVIVALVASLVAIGLIAAGLIWLARRRARNTVEGKIKSYRKKSVEVMDRLDALKERLKLLPSEDVDFKAPMSGETLAFYEEIQQNLARLWDRWLEVMDALDKAQALARENSALGSQKLKDAEQLVSGSKVFEQIDAESKACASSMDRLNHAHEEARAAAEALKGKITSIRGAVDRLGKDGLPTAPYQPEIDAIAMRASQVEAILTPDPIGAGSQASQARDRSTLLQQRVSRIQEIHQEARTLTETLSAQREQAAKYRQEGLRLDEQGGNPDHPLAQAARFVEQLEKALNEGNPRAAGVHLAAARASLDQARQTLEGVLKAREFCDSQQPDRLRETQRLREATAQYEAFEAELRRDFAPASWQNVAGNLAQAKALLQTFDRKAQEAAAAASSTDQKYLLAARLLGQLGQEQQAVFRLMTALGEQLTGLRAFREECQKLAHELADQSAAATPFFERNEQSIGAIARDSLAAAQESQRQAEVLLNDKPPDWPRLRQLLDKAMQGQAMARNQAETDVRLAQQVSSELDQVLRDADRVRSFLAGHEQDRPAANQHYHSAEDALNRVRDESARPGGEWARLLELVRGAAADLAHAQRLAQEDVRLAGQAEAEIAEAEHAIRKAKTFFSMGVTLDTSSALAQLTEAQRLYGSQNYEQAILVAGKVIGQIRQDHAVAVQQAFRRQMQTGSNIGPYQAPPYGGGSIGLADAAAAVAAAAGTVIGSAIAASTSQQPIAPSRSQPVEKTPNIE